MSDPTAALRIAYDRDHDVGDAALRGMRIELAAWLTDEIYECGALLHERQVRKPGYLRSWRWRVGCRLLERLVGMWPPELADEREIRLLVYRTKRFLNRTAMSAEPPAVPVKAASVLTTRELEVPSAGSQPASTTHLLHNAWRHRSVR